MLVMLLLLLHKAIAGDKIDDVWAQEVLDLAYDESTLALGPYRATHVSDRQVRFGNWDVSFGTDGAFAVK